MSLEVREVRSRDDADLVIALVHEFVEWLKNRYPDRREHVDSYFESEGLDAQLCALSEESGREYPKVLLALFEGEPAGTVTLNRIDGATCQMNRLFVSGRFRGQRIGRLLCEHLIDLARAMGFHRMRLHTTGRQFESKSLYLSMGFQSCEPYDAGSELAEHFELLLERYDPIAPVTSGEP